MMLDGCANVLDAGAKPDGSADATGDIQQELDTKSCVIVPPGVYRIDGTLQVKKALQLQPGAVLKRMSPSTSAEPVVLLCAQHALLCGYGAVASDNASPHGVVRVGPVAGQGNDQAVLWPRIDGITIEGKVTGDPSVGLYLDSTDPANPRDNNVTYNGSFSNLFIQYVDVGCRVGPFCNGHGFSNIFFHAIGRYCYWSIGRNSNNTFIGGFTYLSAGVTMIRLEGDVRGNLFYGVQGEPGGPAGQPVSHYYQVDTATQYCQIIGQNSCTGPSTYTPPAADPGDPHALDRALTYLSSGFLSTVNLQTISHQAKWFPPPYQAVPTGGAAQSDSKATSLDQLRVDLNSLLATLRAAGVLKSS